MEISIGEIITLCGGASTIIAGIVGYIAQRIANKRNEGWRLNTESDLKRLDNKLSEKSSLLNNLIDVQKSNYSFSQEKRISSIEKVWVALEKMKNNISPNIEFLFDSITEHEINDLNKTDLSENQLFFLNQLKNIKYDNFYLESNTFNRVLFAERPFIGDDLWVSLTIYSKYLARLVYLAHSGISNKSLKPFGQDVALIEMLKTNFLPTQISAISNSNINSFSLMCFLNENKIIEQINDVLSGKIASSSSFQQIQQVREMLNKLDINKNNTQSHP